MFLLRVALPDRPGSLGLVASAIGAVQGDINAIEVIERIDGYAVIDFTLAVPPDILPDTLVTACSSLPDVEVMWVSHHPEGDGLRTDVDVLTRMAEDPRQAESILLNSAPAAFRVNWALIVDRRQGRVTAATDLAPELTPDQVSALGDLTRPRTLELASGWVDGWGETVVAVSPFARESTMVIGRSGGPEFRPSELARLRLLSMLAGIDG